ncbi:MAG: menaquinol-cytochrome C reductase [Anaerolineae bacterium]
MTISESDKSKREAGNRALDRGTGLPWRERGDRRGEGNPQERVMVWPNLLIIEFLIALAVTLLLFIFSLIRNAPLEEMANPDLTPNPAKAPWYFVSLQELLLHMHPGLAGVIIPALLILFLMAIPYLDASREGVGVWFGSTKGRVIVLFSLIYTTVAVPSLILIDSYVGGVGGTGGGIGVLLEGWPPWIADWLLPNIIIIGFSALLATIVRLVWKANAQEILIALFTGFVLSYFILTFFGFLSRGPEMRLYPPWDMPGGYNPWDAF